MYMSNVRKDKVNGSSMAMFEQDATKIRGIYALKLLQAMQGIFLTIHVVDLQQMTVEEYATTEPVTHWLNGDGPLNVKVRNVMNDVVVQEQHCRVFDFVDLTTLSERLRDTDLITVEFISIYNGWCEASWMVLERDEKGQAVLVAFLTRIIEERKQREERLLRQSNTDGITGFLNRRAYEEQMELLTCRPARDFVFVVLDVNGLKEVNDSLGHSAGDELLRGAAYCINHCFGEYGRIYRTGGDEFAALLHVSEEQMLDLSFVFERTMAEWTGTRVKEIGISWGYAMAKDYPVATVLELSHLADNRMYRAKEQFYSRNGMDRRAQRTAYEAVCASYIKVLKVDLAENSYQILQLDGLEHSPAYGFRAELGRWIHDFGVAGGVHKDDLEYYLDKTNLADLRGYFLGGARELVLYYRRLVHSEYRRVMMELVAAPEYSTERQLVYLYVKDIEK